MQSPGPGIPSVLLRYPEEVQNAYARFAKSGGAADLKVIVHAALREFMPGNKNRESHPVLGPELKLVEDLGIDSLAVAEMIFFFEDLFSISIPTNEIHGLTTIGDLEAYVSQKLVTEKPTT